MRTCSPSEFNRRWPGTLSPLVVPGPLPAIPDDCRWLLTEFGLPRKMTIECCVDTTLTFSGTATPLAVIWEACLKQGQKVGKMPRDWNRFWHLADQDYCQGAAWICIEETTAGWPRLARSGAYRGGDRRKRL